jgi:hypothetical protein
MDLIPIILSNRWEHLRFKNDGDTAFYKRYAGRVLMVEPVGSDGRIMFTGAAQTYSKQIRYGSVCIDRVWWDYAPARDIVKMRLK